MITKTRYIQDGLETPDQDKLQPLPRADQSTDLNIVKPLYMDHFGELEAASLL